MEWGGRVLQGCGVGEAAGGRAAVSFGTDGRRLRIDLTASSPAE